MIPHLSRVMQPFLHAKIESRAAMLQRESNMTFSRYRVQLLAAISDPADASASIALRVPSIAVTTARLSVSTKSLMWRMSSASLMRCSASPMTGALLRMPASVERH